VKVSAGRKSAADEVPAAEVCLPATSGTAQAKGTVAAFAPKRDGVERNREEAAALGAEKPPIADADAAPFRSNSEDRTVGAPNGLRWAITLP
jgi:hypothetical protein